MPPTKPKTAPAFAITAPGLEPLCAAELSALGVHGRVIDGGVEWDWRDDMRSIARANLWLRTASRVVIRIAQFRAKAFFELELQAKQIDWARYVARGATIEFHVTCRKSKLYHSGAVAQRFAEAVARVVPGVVVAKTKAASDEDDEASTVGRQLFIVRFVHDVCTVSADSSGALLHLRGYRQQIAKAPLRETLAASVLLGAGWDGSIALTDPMCGSGTIPIEAAMIARRMAPGRSRGFAFQLWPGVDEKTWKPLFEDARANERARSSVEIEGFDRDAGAIEASRANAQRAGVADDIDFAVQPISALPSAEPPGLIASNPPYGVRVGEADRLRNLYAQLGNVTRARRQGWNVALLSASAPLERQTGFDLDERFATRNGGIPVRLVAGGIT